MELSKAETAIKWCGIAYLVLFGAFLVYSGFREDDAGAGAFGMLSVLVGVSSGIGAVVERNHKH